MGLIVLALAITRSRVEPAGTRLADGVRRLWPVFAGGLVIVLPWLVRNVVDMGGPFPGQAIENLFLRRNEDIFAFADRPSAAAYLGQGLAVVIGNPLAAAWAAFVEVLIVPAFPIGVAGLVSVVGLRRSPSLRHPTALQALLLSGALTFVATALLFPVASRWGTFMHASGPLLLGLTAAAALGADAALARLSRWRGWPRVNVVIGPAALVVLVGAMGLLQLQLLANQTGRHEARYAAVAGDLGRVAAEAGDAAPRVVMTDHPMWLATVTGRPAIAVPDEDPSSLQELGRRFGTDWLVIMDERGRYPDALLEEPGAGCLADAPLAVGDGSDPGWLFRLAPSCDG
jgi:hypothetical protein